MIHELLDEIENLRKSNNALLAAVKHYSTGDPYIHHDIVGKSKEMQVLKYEYCPRIAKEALKKHENIFSKS